MYEVVRFYEDNTEEILFQGMNERESVLLSYSLNRGLSIDSKYYHEAREQKVDVPINLRLRR